MDKKWISPKTITGDAATGERYLRRQHINEDFWREVEKGNHILFVAPRRVGKTSILKDLEANPREGYCCIYKDIEGAKSKNEFYQRLFELILQGVNTATKAKVYFKTLIKKYGIEQISTSGIKISRTDIDYENELRSLIPDLKNANINTVIFLDEFAEVINKLNRQGLQREAVDILHTLREIRSDSNFGHLTLVFAGSIGLEFVIKTMDRPKLINDLHPIHTGEMTESECTTLIRQLTQEATIKLDDEIIVYLQGKVKHLLPYYIQLMLEEMDLVGREMDEPKISNEMVDKAFDRVLRKNKNFEDWLVRLKDYQPEHFGFINEILKGCAHKDKMSVQEIYNIASGEQFKRTDDYMDFVEQLQNEGYLIEIDKYTYSFISPFLKQFWLNKYPVYNG